jgi:predicted acetyltransferase
MSAHRSALRLEQPSVALLPAFLAMAREFAAHGEPRYEAALHDPEVYLQRLARLAAGVNLPADRVPETTFWAVCGDQVLAVSRLRHRLTPTLEQIGGHIAYEVRPSAQRQGVGTQLLALTLAEARALGLSRILITCDLSNRGSARVIESNSGVLEDERMVPGHPEPIARYWVAL